MATKKLKYNSEKLDSCLNTFRETFSKPEIDNFKGSVILPLDFSLEMDGIAGLIPHSAFEIPTNSLPSNYIVKTGVDKGKSKIAFILHTIDHNFNNNKWTTKITGQTLNIRFDELTETQKVALETQTQTPSSSTGRCIEPYTNANLNKGWEGKKQNFISTVVDPKIEGPKLVKKYGKTLTQAILATIQIEQGYRGFNWNLGGFDITSGGWSFNPKFHNGYVVAKEGGTGLCKAFISFISFETFIEQKVDTYKRKGFENATTSDKFANIWYEKWNGFGARALRSDEENLRIAKKAWLDNSKYV
jgi:hypothetical protein